MRPNDINDLLAELAPTTLPLIQQQVLEAAAMLAPKEDGIFAQFRTDPVRYVREVLKMEPWSMQVEALELLVRPQDDEWQGKLAIGAGISTGKTALGGMIVNWYFDCIGPCIIATTAPSQQSVKDLLWKEVRIQRARADAKWGVGEKDFAGPQATEMRKSPDWWARGFVAAKGETFKGRHVHNMCFLFDEAVGLNELYFRATKLMFKPNTSMLWLAFFNPTDTTSTMYHEIIRPDSTWTVMELSSFDHPNIQAALNEEPLPIPSGVSLEQVEEAMLDDCEPVDAADKTEEDFEWPVGSGDWWRPGPSFCGEFLGRWPSGDDSALWSDALWRSVAKPLTLEQVRIDAEEIPRIGADIARHGEDKTCLHVSWGDYSVHHESRGKVDPARTTGRIIELADLWAEKSNEARKGTDAPLVTGQMVPIMIDDDGVGGTIASFMRERGYRVFPIGAATKATKQNRYRNKRSELWFVTRERAKLGKLKLGLLPAKVLMELRRQAMAPLWSLNSAGQREVEPKDDTKKRLGRSPDDCDAMNLSYYVIDSRMPEVMNIKGTTFQERMEATKDERQPTWQRREGRRGIFRRS